MPFDPLRRRTPAGLATRAEVNQGALVAGIALPRYGSGSYYGFFLTARCDLAHVRTDTVNLLPVVPLSEWLMFDGCIGILLSRLLALETRLDELSDNLPIGLTDLVRAEWDAGYRLFIADHPDVQQSTKDRFRSALDEYIELKKILDLNTESPIAVRAALGTSNTFRQLVEREREKKVLALVENRVLDAHFLPVVRTSESLSQGPGYVILFRQILSMPGRLLEPLKNGLLSLNELSEPLRTQARGSLVCPSEIVSNIASPHVEHVLQRFSNVFGRVGVPDSSKRYREWLVKTICEAPPK